MNFATRLNIVIIHHSQLTIFVAFYINNERTKKIFNHFCTALC